MESSFSQKIFFPNTHVAAPEIMPKFYKNTLKTWEELHNDPILTISILEQCIWYNKFILIDNVTIKRTIRKDLFMSDLFDEDGNLSTWQTFRDKMCLNNSEFFKWRQIIDAIPQRWKVTVRDDSNFDIALQNDKKDQHCLNLTKLRPLEKLSSTFIYTANVQKKAKT